MLVLKADQMHFHQKQRYQTVKIPTGQRMAFQALVVLPARRVGRRQSRRLGKKVVRMQRIVMLVQMERTVRE